MEKQPLLQYYTDETWGYDTWDEENKKGEGIRVKFQQEENETRENFFKRLGFEPNAKEYGSNIKWDEAIHDQRRADCEKIASEGYGLRAMLKSKDGWIRSYVARQGYALDELIKDKSPVVRREVARRGYGLDILVDDKDEIVRAAVAGWSYNLEKLVFDKSEHVQKAVIRRGYGLDFLYNRYLINEDVVKFLKKHGYSCIMDWAFENPDKCVNKDASVYPLLQYYSDSTWGYDIWDEKRKKQDGISVLFQQGKNESRGDFFGRIGMFPKPRNYGSELKNDWLIAYGERAAYDEVIDERYALDFFLHHKDWSVRWKLADRGLCLDVLVNDEDECVRKTVAEQDFGLDILVHDEDCQVRAAVARQGYGLNLLIDDPEKYVRDDVEREIQECGYPSVEAWAEDNPDKVVGKKNSR